MQTKYQILFLGQINGFRKQIEQLFLKRLTELGLRKSNISIFDAAGFSKYKSNAPSVCIYFGDTSKSKDLHSITTLLNDACLIIPVVQDIKGFSSQVPDAIRPINGFELNNDNAPAKIPALVSRMLEGLSLLRKTRKLFISYRRKESRGIALQLYSFLDERGFNVFLDTHVIGPGSKFQDELWHNLADTDVLLLLNTQNFVGNKWTDAELAQASAMSIGISQLVWPNCHNRALIDKTAFATPVYLKDTDFINKHYHDDTAKLEDDFLKTIEKDIESLRARSLAARQDNLIKEFFKSAKKHLINATLQSEKVIIIPTKTKGKVAIIPTVGVPDIYSSYQRENIIKEVYKNDVTEAWILYDHRNVLQEYLVFVTWLNPLSVKFLKITELDEWLKKIQL